MYVLMFQREPLHVGGLRRNSPLFTEVEVKHRLKEMGTSAANEVTIYELIERKLVTKTITVTEFE